MYNVETLKLLDKCNTSMAKLMKVVGRLFKDRELTITPESRDAALKRMAKLLKDLGTLQLSNFWDIPAYLRDIDIEEYKKLGEGGFGSVVALNSKYALKSTRPCDISVRYCDLLKDGKITHSYDSSGKKLVIIPNYLMESLIGGLLNNLVTSNIAPFFIHNYGCWYEMRRDATRVAIYNLVERASGTIYTWLDHGHDTDTSRLTAANMVMQTFYALLAAEQCFRFTHLDLHHENMLVNSTSMKWIGYPMVCGGGSSKPRYIYLPLNGYILKINDFGLSRIETQDFVINGSVDNYPDLTWGQYLPGYDYIMVLNDFMNRCALNKFKPKQHDLIDLLQQFIKLLPKSDQDVINKQRSCTSTSKWRPNLKKSLNIRPEIWVTTFMKLLIDLKIASFDKPEGEGIMLRPINNGFPLLTTIKQLADPVGIHHVGPAIIMHRDYIVDNQPLKPYNLTFEHRQEKSCPKSRQAMTIATFAYSEVDKLGYKLVAKCCKRDPVAALDNYTGVLTNATFFGLNTDYKPIDVSKSQATSKRGLIIKGSLGVPHEYGDVYTTVVIARNKFWIGNKGVAEPWDAYFMSGPVLVKNGKIVFTEEMLKEERFQCFPGPHIKTSKRVTVANVKFPTGTCKMVKMPAFEVNNCDAIIPGELIHASNPNPRSVLFTVADGFGFLSVEGRSESGDGLDMADLAKLLHKLGATDAVNLDGGRSSKIAWRLESNPGVTWSFHKQALEPYVAGNVIGVVKEIDPRIPKLNPS